MFLVNNSERGQTEVIGFLLILIIFVVVSSVFISTQLPAAQQSQEADKDQQLQSEYRSIPTTVNTAISGTTQSYSIDGRINYTYSFIYRPPPPKIAITEPQISQITVETSDQTYQSFNTNKIEYTNDFNRYTPDTTTRYNQNIVYRFIESSNTIVNPTSQQIIVNDTINVYNHTVETETNTQISKTISAETNSETITPSSPLTIEITNSNMTQDQAEELFINELESNGGNISSITVSGNTLQIQLQPNTYTLNTHTVEFI